MRWIFALCALLSLTACAMPDQQAAPVIEAEVALPDEVISAAPEPACIPGEGDGIGGTGCPALVD